MIIATTTEYGTDADTETASRVTRSIADNFLRRPSVEDRAIRTIASMANNDLSIVRVGEEGGILCDAAFIFLDRDRARFLISGKSACYHFENGKLAHRSLPEEAPCFGDGLRYEPRPEQVFELGQEKNAFLTASRSLPELLSDGEIEELLNRSESPEEWMRLIREAAGDAKVFCGITVFLAPPGKGIFGTAFRRP